MTDPVNKPTHYTSGDIECIDAIIAMGLDVARGFCQGNVVKYLWRWKQKGGHEDLLKAQWYLNKLVEINSEHK